MFESSNTGVGLVLRLWATVSFPDVSKPTTRRWHEQREMSWFGGGLSQISSLTDQISSFTKEVLTETTEEVEGEAGTLQSMILVLISAHLIVS